MFKNMDDFLKGLDGSTLAAVDENQSLTYSELIKRATALSSTLDEKRSLILLECTPSIDWLISYVAILIGKHVPLLLPPNNDAATLQLSKTFKPNFIIKTENGIEVNKISDENISLHQDLCLLLSTSGSTGSPKCVKLSYENIESNTASIVEYLNIHNNAVGIVNLPTNYSYGLSIVNSHLFTGATIGFSSHSITTKEFWDFCKVNNATSFAGVPHNFDLLSKINYEELIPTSIKYFTQAGGKLSSDKVIEFSYFAKKRNCKFFVMYGQTEASPRMSYLPPSMTEQNPDSIGKAVPGGTLKIVNDNGEELPIDEQGELVYTGPNVMMGYALQSKDLSKAKEVFELRTGDIAKKSGNGLFYITGRMSRFIKIFGNRISLDQVESLCNEQNFDAISTGVDEKLLIVTRNIDEVEKIRVYFIKTLKLPKSSIEVKYKEQFPTLPTGKFDYNKLKKELKSTDKTKNKKENLKISDVFEDVFGKEAKNHQLSFVDLGGDSLTFFSISMEIEESLGYLPENWTNLSIEQLENLPKSSLQKTQKKTPLKSLTNIDSLRAFACILVVAFHVFGSYPHYGLGFSMDSPLRSIFDVFDLLRMPLFTALAGVMFVAILPDEKKIPKFLSSKVTSLLLPAIVVSIIYFILRTVTGKEDGNLGNYLVSGYLHFWYLYSLFAIVAVIGAIHLRFKPSFKKYCIGIFILFLLNLLIPNSFLFWMRSAIELSPFFILGILLYKYTDKFYNKKLLYTVCLIALLGTTLRALSFFEVVDRDFVFTYLTFITSLSLVIISYFYFPKVKSIQWVGIYSYAIYLWHPAAASSFRALLNFSGINNRLILFVLLLFVGILVPILIYKVAQYLPRFIRMAFVGR